MKYFFALSLLLIAGCSSPTSNSSNPPPPGWVSIIQPGKFAGVWKLGTVVNSCSTVVTEADYYLRASVANGTTKEVLTLIGGPFPNTVSWAEIPYLHAFAAYDSSNFYGDTDIAPNFFEDVNCSFSNNTDTLFYTTLRGRDTLSITCIRS